MDKEPLSPENSLFLTLMRDMHEAAGDLRWYVWGGMTADILEGRFLREHGDLDGFIENLEQNVESLSAALSQKGTRRRITRNFKT